MTELFQILISIQSFFETIPLSANSPFINCKINKLVIQDKEYNVPDWEAANEILKMCILTKDAFN